MRGGVRYHCSAFGTSGRICSRQSTAVPGLRACSRTNTIKREETIERLRSTHPTVSCSSLIRPNFLTSQLEERIASARALLSVVQPINIGNGDGIHPLPIIVNWQNAQNCLRGRLQNRRNFVKGLVTSTQSAVARLEGNIVRLQEEVERLEPDADRGGNGDNDREDNGDDNNSIDGSVEM